MFFYGEESGGVKDLPSGLVEIRVGFLEDNLELEEALNEQTEEKEVEEEAA